jgi:hypothetical protein
MKLLSLQPLTRDIPKIRLPDTFIDSHVVRNGVELITMLTAEAKNLVNVFFHFFFH